TGDRLIHDLQVSLATLDGFDRTAHDDHFFSFTAALSSLELQDRLQELTLATRPATILGRLSPARWSRRRRAKALLVSLAEQPSEPRMQQLQAALRLECQLRP